MSDCYFLRPDDTVLFIGNSITAQAWPEIDFLTSDIQSQYASLAAGEGRVRFVLSGIGGEQAFEGAARLPGLLDLHKPTVCVVGYGTCEVTFQNERSFTPAMRDILGRLRAVNVATTVVSPPPASPANWQQDAWPAEQFLDSLPHIAAQARDLAARFGVPFVDALAALQQPGPEFTTDGIHLNPHGYRLLATALQTAWHYGAPLGLARR